MAKLTEQAEEKLVFTTRNALIIAGREMGEDGDHWPVIKATVHAVMKDWENLKVERNVHEELKIQLGILLEKMETELPNCAPHEQPRLKQELDSLQEIYDAYFTDIGQAAPDLNGLDLPAHVKSALAILKTLEDDNA